MKVGTEMIGKRVYIRLRVGGSYTGTIASLEQGSTWIYLDNGSSVKVQDGMIASLEVLEIPRAPRFGEMKQ